ncbi:MAG: hypothetical protein BGO97_14180 [Micrococcales bacterium 70-64]|nr:aminoglycoside phosphotransferase family protein [Leifsonia sp.]ODU65064.1 MAG: hypothetical protein ABT06_14180 [Leifsonia sp. SCN 70-46]OJX86756.1 MAG: hypothetical protein BGO97_14180 [Micrococcales bacterium 70-64]
MEIDEQLVRMLVAEQFPQWAHLPVTLVPQGWDHRTFRLGDSLSARLPSAPGYVPQGEKEQRWLPLLAPRLPVEVPRPVAVGRPGQGYPLPWSVYGWIEGDVPAVDSVITDPALATDVAHFLLALQSASDDGPPPGAHSALRGAPPQVYDADVRRCLPLAPGAEAVWDAACRATSREAPVWFHGDVAAGNLVLRDGRLAAVLDFGCSGFGDPACDVAAAWMLFDGAGREAFLAVLRPDPGMLARARGWALWKALLRLEAGEAEGARILDAVVTR